jgi:hypothetical protein
MSDSPSYTVGRYRKLYPRIWRHPGFRALNKSGRELALYLLTGPQTSRIGLFHFSIATAAEDLNVGVETLRERVRDVCVTFGWHFDADARVFYIPSWWRWNPPENENVLKGNLKDLHEIPSCALVDAFARNLETLPETLHQTFMEGCRLRLPERSPIQEQEQDQKQKKKQEHSALMRGALKKNDPFLANDRYLQLAREVLRTTNPSSEIEHLLDAFHWLFNNSNGKGEQCDRHQALTAINAALVERRVS